jgi:signal transduction histidine kinase/CheY-like chemotaxis protein
MLDIQAQIQQRIDAQIKGIEFDIETGKITQTCAAISQMIGVVGLIGYSIYDIFTFLEALKTTLTYTTQPIKLEWVNLHQPYFNGFFDFEIIKNAENTEQALCFIIDNTKILHKITEIQQDRNNTLLHFEKLVDSQNYLEKDRRELRSRNAFLEEQMSFRNGFYAKVTHELRTPINGIVGLANLLTNKESAMNQKYINTIKSSASLLATLVKEFLDISKIHAGRVDFENNAFKLSEVLISITTAFEYLAIEKKLHISYEVSPEIPNDLAGDPTRLSQILYNLVGNATKFTRNGFIKVQVTTHKPPKATEKIWLKFLVEDSGIGIKPDALERIFNSFEQADNTTYREYGGTGLGLHICKQLIELQSGTITLKSTLGKGSKFYFTLPFTKIDAKTFVPTKTKRQPKLDHALNILVAEDDTINQMIIKNMLNSFDVNFKIVDNGIDVLQELANFHFHIILLDIEMPRLDGAETLHLIRTTFEEPYRSVPVLALTGTEPKDNYHYKNLGFDGFLIKPFTKNELFETITKTLSKIQKPQ